jgi:hypothetical protein
MRNICSSPKYAAGGWKQLLSAKRKNLFFFPLETKTSKDKWKRQPGITGKTVLVSHLKHINTIV